MKPRHGSLWRGFAITAKKAILASNGYPSGLCVGTAQTGKGGLAMLRNLVFALLVVALILLLASDAR
jgi:hypothetical protein